MIEVPASFEAGFEAGILFAVIVLGFALLVIPSVIEHWLHGPRCGFCGVRVRENIPECPTCRFPFEYPSGDTP